MCATGTYLGTRETKKWQIRKAISVQPVRYPKQINSIDIAAVRGTIRYGVYPVGTERERRGKR